MIVFYSSKFLTFRRTTYAALMLVVILTTMRGSAAERPAVGAAGQVLAPQILVAPDPTLPLDSAAPTFRWQSSAAGGTYLFERTLVPAQTSVGLLETSVLHIAKLTMTRYRSDHRSPRARSITGMP